MSWENRVIWSEGMFLQTQHFQQDDRYVEGLVRGVTQSLRPYPWGFSELQINRDLLTLGKFGLISAKGVFPDGTPFSIPEDAAHPDPIDIGESVRNCVVSLALPVRQPGGTEFDLSGNEETTARYRAAEIDARDGNADSDSVAAIRVGKLRLKFVLETDEQAGFTTLGITRINEARTDKQVLLDAGYIPPCLDSAASAVLAGFVTDLKGLLHHRAEALAGRLGDGAGRGVAEVAEFLLLQAINRSELQIGHLEGMPGLHPELIYRYTIGLVGELATFTSKSRRPPAFPPYIHHDLQRSFQPVIAALRQALSVMIDPGATSLELQERKYGIKIAPLPDRSLLNTASFVLAVKGDVAAEEIRRRFPQQIKIGPMEVIRDLVSSAVGGIALRPLPVAPRQIPYHAGVVYFELDQANPLWKQMQNSGGLAFHISGEFPGLELQFWGIRNMAG